MSSGVVTAPFPSPFKEGARGIKPLEAEGGVVGKRSRRLLIDIREADLCAAEERDLLIEA
jgi:hypothetical protein